MRRRVGSWRVMFVLFFVSFALLADDWAFFRGPNMNGTAPDKGIYKDWKAKLPPVLWKAELPDGSHCGPCVADGKVFIQIHKADTDGVWAFNIDDGKQAWECPYPALIGEGYGYEKASPAWSDGKLYVISRGGLIVCLTTKDGKTVWYKNMVKDFGGRQPQFHYAGSPLVDGKNLIVCPGGASNSVVALDKTSGNLVWAASLPDILGYSTPITATLNNKKQIVVAFSSALFGLDPVTGKQIWAFSWKTPNGINASTPLPIGNDQVFYASGYDQGCVLFKVTGTNAVEVWSNKELKSTYESPVLMNGDIYGAGEQGQLMCLDVKTGKPVWKANGYQNSSMVAVDGVLVTMVGQGGCCSLVDPSNAAFKEIGRFNPISGGTATAPIISGKKLFIRGGGTLACIDLK